MVSRGKLAAPRVRLRRIGSTFAQSGHQYVAGPSSDSEERMIAPLAGVVVALCTFLGQTVSLVRLRRIESRSMVNGSSPGPAPAPQARAGISRLTRSNCRACPHWKLLRNVPNVDGAFTVQPSTCSVPPARNASASLMQPPAPTPPASAACLPHWPDPAHLLGQRGGPPFGGTGRR